MFVCLIYVYCCTIYECTRNNPAIDNINYIENNWPSFQPVYIIENELNGEKSWLIVITKVYY